MNIDFNQFYKKRYCILKENTGSNPVPPTPASKVPQSKTAEEQQAALKLFDEKWGAGRYYLYKHYPFLGTILSLTNRVRTFDPSFPTAGVDKNNNLYMNVDFGNSLTLQQFIFLLAHEVMHIANFTFSRQHNREHELWNWATDFVMNRDLAKDGFAKIEGGLFPDDNGNITVTGWDPTKNTEKQYTTNITNKSAEQVYDWLDNIPRPPGGGGGGSGGAPDKNGPPSIPPKNGKSSNPPTLIDKPIQPGEEPVPVEGDRPEKTDNPVEEAKRKIDKAAREEDERARSTGRGTEGGSIRGSVKRLMRPKFNWRAILREFASKSLSYVDWKRPNKRAMSGYYYAPTIRRDFDKIDIIVTIDTSGSMGGRQIKAIVSELVGMIKSHPASTIRVLFWHTSVYNDIKLDINSKIEDIRLEAGGTTINSMKQYIDAKKYKAKAIITFTDGQTEEPNLHFNFKPAQLFFIIAPTEEMYVRDGEKFKKYGKTFHLMVSDFD